MTGHLTTICTSALIFAAVLHHSTIQQNIEFLVVSRSELAMKYWCQMASSEGTITTVNETRKQNGECRRIIIKTSWKWQLERLGSTCLWMLCRPVFEKLWPSFTVLREPKRRRHIMACSIIILLLVCSIMSSTTRLIVVTCLVCELALTDFQALIPWWKVYCATSCQKETYIGLPQEIRR